MAAIIEAVDVPFFHARILANLSRVVYGLADFQWLQRIAQQIESASLGVEDSPYRSMILVELVELVEVLARAGEVERAKEITFTIKHQGEQSEACARLTLFHPAGRTLITA
ncbi:hypothetical protein [Actinomadura chokoriensis]|uniref:Uncharacterized protein n=1 Tax=Actinomadura chokoriensis TaxID=454156 RepID=A0ABV4QQ30_9ACTN